MAAFDRALARVRLDGADLHADRIDRLAREQDHIFRDTRLTPGRTLELFVRQVACGNIACSAVRHLSDRDFTDSAWCQARDRLPLELIRQTLAQLVDAARAELSLTDDAGAGSYRWRGHRVHVIDGSADSMPDTPELREHYRVHSGCGQGLGFPIAHLSLLMDHASGLLIDCLDDPMNTHDLSRASALHRHLQEGDLLLGDDPFSGYTHLALVLQGKMHAVMPVQHKRIVDFTPGRSHVPRRGNTKRSSRGKPRSRLVRTLGKDDQLVEYFKPDNKPPWLERDQFDALPESIVVREVRRTIRRRGFRPLTVTIVTTLLDPQSYPPEELIELRLTRWMIETGIRHLKSTLGMDVLKCKTVAGVQKERLVFVLVYNLIRVLMLKAARHRRVNVNRLSFADTLAWLRFGDVDDPELKLNPLRPGRLEPRAIKRQKKEYPYMTQPRTLLRAQLRARLCDTT
jgi:Transposase DDE domain